MEDLGKYCRGPGEMEDPGKWMTWGVGGPMKMHGGLEKSRTLVNRGPGEMEHPGNPGTP
jgi:hypothetical protein